MEQVSAHTESHKDTNPPEPAPRKSTKLDKIKSQFSNIPDDDIDDKECKRLKSMLISAFSDTFAEDLEGRPLLVGPDEEITFVKDPSVTPLTVSCPRVTPIGWRAEADLLIRNLLKSMII